MGLDYSIEYLRGKENVVIDALSRKEEVGQCQAIFVAIREWMKEVAGSYE